MPMRRCYISVGGNIRPEEAIPQALDMLHGVCPIHAVSTFYRTAALDRPEQPPYLNGVALILYDGHPGLLKRDILRPIEAALGRVRTVDPYAARPVDLDVILCGTLVVDESGLRLPDPDIRARVFLVAGLMELEPELILPGTALPIKDLFTQEQRDALMPDMPFTTAIKERFYA